MFYVFFTYRYCISDASIGWGCRFEIEVGKTSIGADISWLSQFEGEKEYCYAPLTHLQLVGTPRLEQHSGTTLSIVRLRLTVNQRSKTVEQAERARTDFLKQLASSLEWDVRHWCKRQQLLERLAPEVDALRAALQAVVEGAVPSELNDNTTFGVWVGRVIDASEAQRRQLAEAVWQDGEAALQRGEAGEAAALFDKAIDARGRGLCADEKAGRDRVVEMRRARMRATGGGEDKEEEADAKLALANDLKDQGAYDEALELYYQAVELYTQVFGQDWPDLAKSYNNIGVVYEKKGDLENALLQYQKALEVFLAVFGQEHPLVAASCQNIAAVYQKQGKEAQAIEMVTKAYDITLKVLGPGHPRTKNLKSYLGK